MANKRTNERSTLHISVRYDTSDAKRDIRGLIDNFELLQKESQIDVGLKNIEGVGGAIHEFKTLDGQLTDIADDSKLAGKQIDENISKAVNSAIDNISTLTGKTNDLLDLLRKIGRGEGSADDIKKLATDLQTNFGLLGVKFDANEVLGMTDVQQQFEALSKGVVQFASTWGVSAQNVINDNLGISDSLNDIASCGKNLDALKSRFEQLSKAANKFKESFEKLNTFNEDTLTKEESKNAEEFAKKAYDQYKKAIQIYNNKELNITDRYIALTEAMSAMNDMEKVYNSRAYKGFADKNLKQFFTLPDKFGKSQSGLKDHVRAIREKIQKQFTSEMASLEGQLGSAVIETTIDIKPEPDKKAKKKVQSAVEQSVPDKVETPVEVEVDAKPKIDDTKIINNLEDALKKFRDSKRKDNVAANEAAQLVLSLKDLGYGEDDIKQRLSTNGKRTLASDAMGKAITQAEQLRKQLPEVSVEVDKLNRLLGEDVSADDKFKSFVKAVDSGEMSVEEAHNAITAMKKELAKDDASPGIDKLKNALKQIFKIKDLDELQASWKETVAAVESGSKDWVDALADISKAETNIRNLRSKAKDKDINKFKGQAEKAKQDAADAREEARKAQDELESLKRQQGSNIKPKTPKVSGAGTGGSGAGTGTGSGSGTSDATPSQPSKPVTTPSVEAEIKDLERLEGKVKEVENTIRTTKTQAFKDEQQVVESVVEAEKIKLGELEAKVVEVGNKIDAIGQGADGGTKPTLSLYDQILDKMKKIAEEKKKISKEPSNKKMDYISDEIEIYGNNIKDIEQAQKNIKQLTESVKYLLTLDKSIPSQSLAFENGGVKDQRLVDIISSIRGSDAPWLSNWDAIITQMESKLISLITFIKNNDGKLEDFLSVDELSVLNTFGIDKVQKEFEEYCAETKKITSINREARRSIEDIAEDILVLGRAAGASEKELDDLYIYLRNFSLPRIEMGSPEAETTYVASKLGVAQPSNVSPTINEKTTAFKEEQSTVSSVVDAEIQDLNRLKKAIEKVTAAVNYKTKAFKEEQGVVDKVVGSEIGKLSDLKDELEKEVKIPSVVSKDENDNNNTPTIDSTLSSALLELQKALSAMIGSTDPTTQNTDADKGLSGIAKNVKAIYDHLVHDQEEKKPVQNDGVEDTTSDIDEKKLVGVLDELTQVISKLQSWLNNNTNKDNSDELNEFNTKVITPLSQAIQELRDVIKVDDDKPTTNTPEVNTTPEPKLTDTENDKEKPTINIEGLNSISDNVVKIHDILSKKEKSDEQLATSLKNAADGLKDATKYIEEDAKSRNDTNKQYMDSASKISTAEGRKQVLEQALTGTDMKQVGTVDYAPLANGKVKVSTVVEDTNGKLYDFAATVDKVGQSVAPLVENGRRSQQVIEERRKALEAQTVAEQKATQVSEEKLVNDKEVSPASNGTTSINVLDGVLKSTTKMYDDFSSANVGNVPDGIKDEYSDLLNLIKKIKEENRNLEKSEVESIEKTCKAIQNKIVLLGIESQNYDEKLSKMKDSTVDNGTSLLGDKDAVAIQKNFDEIEERTKKLQEKLNESDKSIFNKEELKQEQKELDNLIAKTEKLITTAKANKSKGALTKPQLNQFIKAESAYNESDANSKQLNLSQEGLASLDKYKQKYQELVTLKEKFQSSSKNDITEDDIKAWSRLTQELKECREEYEVFEKVASSGGKMMFASDEAIKNTESLKDEMIKLAKATEQGKASAPQWADEFNKLTMTFEDADHQLKTVVVTYDGVTKTLTKSIAGVKQTQSAWEKFSTSVSNKMREMGAYFATFVSFYEVVAVIRQGVTYVREIDSALTELKKVTDETDESYNRFLQTMSKTAGSIGSTVKDLTSSAADWARLGYTMEEAGELAKNTAILMNVSEFDNVNDATDSLVSTMQAFKYEASESMDIINMLNQIGNNYAISTSDLASSLMRSSGALQAANNSLAESVALTTAANTTMQDPEGVGNALKVISMRIRGVKTDLEEAGEETDGMVTNTAKLQEKIEALTNIDGDGGVNILTDTGAFKSTYQIISEIGRVWAQMDDMSQAALLEMLAGKQRSSVVAALLNDAELLEDIYDSAIGSSGSATRELNIYLDSIQGKIDKFNNSLQTLWMNLISSDKVKGFVDLGTTILDIINKVGSLKVAIAALFGLIFLKYKAIQKETGIFNMLITSLGDFSGKKIKGITTGLKSILSAFTAAGGGAAGFKASLGALGTAIGPVGIAIAAITTGLIALTWAWNNVLPTNAKFTKDLKEATDELTEVQNKLESLNNEFDVTKSRIEELEKKDTLSFVEEEELAKLKAQNAELERQIRLEEAREKREKQKQINAALGVAKTDTNLKNKYVRKDDGSYGAPTGHNDTSDLAGNEWEQNLNALETATKDLDNAQKALDDAVVSGMDTNSKEFKALEKDVEDAEKRVSSLNSEIDNLADDWQTSYGDVGYIANATTEQEKAWNELYSQYQNYINKQALLNGDFSQADYLNTIFGANATEEAKKFKEEFNKALQDDAEYVQLKAKLDVAELDLEDAKKSLSDIKTEAAALGVDLSKTKYGNIDTDTRAKLQWNEENLNRYKNQLISWFGNNMSWEEIVSDFEGTYSTVLGDFSSFGEYKIPIAFTALLQTADGGVEYLDANTVSNYIEQIVAEATKDGSWTANEIFKLDEQGIGNIKGLIADVGETAEFTSQAMHFAGATGAVADMTNHVENLEDEVNSLSSNIEGLSFEEKFTELANKYPAIFSMLQQFGIDAQQLQKFFTQTGEGAEQAAEKIKTTVTSIDALTGAIESYKSALTVVNNITSDGQAISEDYYNTLKEQLGDITVGEQDLSDAIDITNGYVVKNASLLNKLVNQSRKAQKATIQVAKAQAQTQYKELIKQIRNSIIYLGAAAQANGFVTQATFDNIDAMQKQLASLKQTIQQYALLELSLSDAANAFDEYEKAKERDAQLTYDDSMLEMLKTIDEDILKNETGTEAFEYAVRAIVPEQFWKDIDDVDEKIRSIHDYIDGDNVFSRFFYVDEESGELDITTDNVREFVDLCINSGLFDGSSKDFALSNSVEGVEDFAEALGVTEPVILAMLTALEKVDAKWGNILTDVTTKPLDREINKAVDEVDTSTQKIEDFWKAAIASGKFDNAEYQKLINELDTANKKLQEAEQKAQENARQYNLCQTAISAYRGELKLTQDQADSLARSLGFIDENGNPTISVNNDGTLNLTDEQLSTLLQKLGLLEEPSIIQIQLRYDNIVAQIDELQKYIDGKINDPNDSEILKSLKITNVEEAKAKVNELIPEKDQIELTYNITETSSEEQKSVLESYQELAKNGMEFTVTADVTDANEKIDELNNNNPKDKEVVFTADGSTASDVIAGIARQLAALPDDVSITIETKEKKTIFETVVKAITGGSKETSTDTTLNNPKRYRGLTMALGNAHATGSVGLKTSESDAVVGELGREMIVDPVKGVYYTVGDNGTEMVDLPKGAIIYNHKQTEELLKNGHTSRGKLTGGLSFAHGNAHGSYGIPSYHPNLEDSTSLKNHTNVNTKWDDATSTLLDAADSLAESSSNLDDASEAFEDAINWIDVLFTRIENNISEQEAYLETLIDTSGIKSVKDVFYGGITDQLRNRAYYSLEAANYYRDKANVEMTGLPAEIQNRIKSGAINIQDFKFEKSTEGLTDEQKKVVEKEREAYEKYVERINQAIEYYDKISEYEQQYYTTITEIADKAVEHQEDVAQGFENEIGLVEHLNDMLEAHNDLQEAKEGFATEAYYDAQIDANETMLAQYKAERKALQDVLDEEVRLGHVKVGSQQWFDMQQAIYDVDDAIIDTEASIEDLQNSINDLKWDKFDELINRYDYVGDEISNVIQLLSHDPDGLIMEELRDLTSDNWATDSGLTTIGMYAQEMERAQYVANQYAEAIKDLEKDYASGKYNETEYLNKLNELISAQYENLENYHDAKDAIVELNEARVDAIRDGIEKEIDAYQELINKKKELLDREQDLHSFNNEIEEKEKDVADLRKQLAAMDGDTTQATTAKKKQLQEQLVEAQKSLEESYYSHSMTERQNALDKEFESFEEEKNKEIETWEKWLEDSTTVIDESLAYVQENTQTVYNTLSEMGSQYGLTLSTNITEPWTNGEFAISSYSDTFETAVSAFTKQLDNIALHWESVTTAAEEAARVQANALQQEYKATTNQITTANKNPSSNSTITPNSPTATNKAPTTTNNTNTQKTISVGGKINAGSAKIYDYAGDTSGELQYYRNDPIYTVLQELNGYLLVRYHKLKSGYTGWFKKSDVKAYASGLSKAKDDHWAIINELGSELQLVPGKSGNLEYVKYGTSILPHDISSKLMDIALDPVSVFDDIKAGVKVPTIETKDFNYEFNFDSLLHVDNCNQDSIPALQKMIRTEFNSMMKQVNASLRRA